MFESLLFISIILFFFVVCVPLWVMFSYCIGWLFLWFVKHLIVREQR